MSVARLCRALVRAGAAALALLVVTGLWLIRFYRPPPSFFGLGNTRPTSVAVAVALHRVGAGVLLLASGLLLGVRLASAARRAAPAALAVAAAVGAVVTGRRLAWNQLALRAVKANLDAAGMLFAAFDSTVRYVFVPGRGEVGQRAFRTTLGIHAVAFPLAVVGLLLIEWWAQRALDRPTAPAT